MDSPTFRPRPSVESLDDSSGLESGYASADDCDSSRQCVVFTRSHLKFLNQKFAKLPPEDILKWAITSLPSLFQETAFGLTGLVTLDMLSKLPAPFNAEVGLIFLDTLHHFDETLALVDKVQAQYPNIKVHKFKPRGVVNAKEFAVRYGETLWKTNQDSYDWYGKVEPKERAYTDLNVKAVLTGRRKAQGGAREKLDVIEVDDTGVIKVNPLAHWTFPQVQAYIKENNVPYNSLLDQGYKSVGDWHSTSPVSEGEDERAGRWKGQQKTECGIHNPKSRYAQILKEQGKREQESAIEHATEARAIVVA
ncbi:MAG: hypothetical protein M1831_004522 [Alyxoria varia]|nr:MAG: hypothetical protein M1831_004522 [Alyxoria varia]